MHMKILLLFFLGIFINRWEIQALKCFCEAQPYFPCEKGVCEIPEKHCNNNFKPRCKQWATSLNGLETPGERLCECLGSWRKDEVFDLDNVEL